jgi:hypothetical protein
MLCQRSQGRGGVADHDVERERRRVGEARDQSEIRQTGGEEPIRASFRICACSLDRLDDHGIVVLFGWSLEKDVCPRIDEEVDLGCIGRLPSAPDAIDLIDRLAKFAVRRKAVLQVAPHGPRVDRQTDGLADHFRRVAVAAFQIDRHRWVGRGDDPTQIVDRPRERNALAIGEAVCIGDRPAARRDRLGTARGDGLGIADMPDVEEDERLSRDMQRPELLSLALLIGHVFLLLDQQAVRHGCLQAVIDPSAQPPASVRAVPC